MAYKLTMRLAQETIGFDLICGRPEQALLQDNVA